MATRKRPRGGSPSKSTPVVPEWLGPDTAAPDPQNEPLFAALVESVGQAADGAGSGAEKSGS